MGIVIGPFDTKSWNRLRDIRDNLFAAREENNVELIKKYNFWFKYYIGDAVL